MQRAFYLELSRKEGWGIRVLGDRIDGVLYEWTMLSKMPETLIKHELDVLKSEGTVTLDLVFRDPYLLNFLGLKDTYSEQDIESSILHQLQLFIIELGTDLAFVARQKRIIIEKLALDIQKLAALKSILKEMYDERRPFKYLFESDQPGMPYCARSAQRIFQNARIMAGIKKEVSFHSLRHSFATHLLEKGIDVIYIKDILGHFNIKTTQRYLHVRKEQLITIISPLDDLWKKEGIEI